MKRNSKIFNKKNIDRIVRYLENLEGDYIEIELVEGERSEAFKKWYFAGLRDYLVELGFIDFDRMTKAEAGRVHEIMHNFMKEMFIGFREIEVNGKVERIMPSTNDLSNKEMQIFTDNVFGLLNKMTPMSWEKFD